MTLWLIRAGKHGEREDLALENDAAIVGWEEVSDLGDIKERNALRERLQKTYPDVKPNTLRNWESQLWPLIETIQVGDLVALPLKKRAVIALGRVTGRYQYRTFGKHGALHSLPVKWLKEVPRSQFDPDLLYSLGAFMTVCRIARNQAEERIGAMLAGKTFVPKADVDDAPEAEGVENRDLESLSQDRIRSHIIRRFKGHKLATLVAEIFKAQGFKTKISPPGPDGGVDILAGNGVLGFGEPRLVIQVKSQETPVDAKELREFRTTISECGAQHGVFVSWGGFKKMPTKDGNMQFFNLRLWEAEEVIAALQENYDKLPEDLQAEIPLKRIWTLVVDEEMES